MSELEQLLQVNHLRTDFNIQSIQRARDKLARYADQPGPKQEFYAAELKRYDGILNTLQNKGA